MFSRKYLVEPDAQVELEEYLLKNEWDLKIQGNFKIFSKKRLWRTMNVFVANPPMNLSKTLILSNSMPIVDLIIVTSPSIILFVMLNFIIGIITGLLGDSIVFTIVQIGSLYFLYKLIHSIWIKYYFKKSELQEIELLLKEKKND